VSKALQTEIKETCGVKDWDAFHLAAAIGGKAQFFITVDKYIIRRAEAIEKFGIRVRDPLGFLQEVKYEQRT